MMTDRLAGINGQKREHGDMAGNEFATFRLAFDSDFAL